MEQNTVAGPSTAPERQLMPGSFNPGDYVDFHDSPFEAFGSIQESGQSEDTPGVAWSSEKLLELDLEGVEWFNYEPPAALSKAPNVSSEVLQSLVTASIETVRTAAQEEKRRKADAEEAERRANTDQNKLGQGEEPYLPVLIPVEKPVEKPLPTPPISEPEKAFSEDRSSDELSLRRAEAVKSLSRSKSPGLSSLGSSEKASKLKLRRFLGWTDEKSHGKPEKTSRGVFTRKFLAGSQDTHANNVSSVYQAKPKPKMRFVNGNYVLDTKVEVEKTGVAQAEKSEPEPEPEPEPVEIIECVSCLDDFPLTDTIKVPCHSYCLDCFVGLVSVSVQNEQQWPPKCCLNEIPFRTIFKYVPDDLQARFRDRSAEWKLPVQDRVYCNDANCGLWIPPKKISAAEQVGRCRSGHRTCVMCRGKSHGSKPCERDTNLSLTQQLAEEQGWKQCGKCKAYVEHVQACRHITCRCGYQFCYVCGQKWCTCHCTEDQLAVIKEQAFDKANERRSREAAERAREIAEAEDVRRALAQVAEFEREEALKAEMLRAEQERLELERQQRELEERARREAIRRAELSAKFTELRKGLELLHDLQVVILENDHGKLAESLADEIHEASTRLNEKHQQERADAETDTKSKLEAKDDMFGQDYCQRSAAEKQMIQEYKTQLEAFYSRHPCAAQEIEKALEPLLQRMEENQRAYNEWKNGELEKYHNKLKDRQLIKEEYRYSAKARLQDSQDQKEMELVRRTVAESKWMNMVVLERERMLGTMEVEELEGDADSLFGDVEIEGVGRAL